MTSRIYSDGSNLVLNWDENHCYTMKNPIIRNVGVHYDCGLQHLGDVVYQGLQEHSVSLDIVSGGPVFVGPPMDFKPAKDMTISELFQVIEGKIKERDDI